MRALTLCAAATALAMPLTPALADPPAYGYSERYDDDRVYAARGRHYEPRRVSHRDRVWQGRDGRYYCRRANGTTGLIIGAAGGALLGREVDSRGDRAVGTIVGAALGGLLGREIDRGRARCR
jgi:Glycine zipper 2TM domain